ITTELILVEWNPPPDRDPLYKALVFPQESSYLTIRVLVVPPRIHQRYENAHLSPINNSVAVNCGIRRARGQFVVLRASDIIWSEEVLALLAAGQLEPNSKYRCTRCDVAAEVLEYHHWTVAQKLEFCREHVTTRMIKMKYYVGGLPDLRLNSDGDFQLLSLDNMKKLRGYRECAQINSSYCDGLLEFCAYAAGIKDVLLDCSIYKIEHGSSYRNRILQSIIPFPAWLGRFIPANLFGPSFVRLARASGISRWLYDTRVIKVRGIRQPTRREYYELCKKIVRGQAGYVLNEEDWGLANEALAENCVLKANWDRS
ncbi:MAG: hypothetical protein C4542_06115, partial [Dehalococcoidia bacterium]